MKAIEDEMHLRLLGDLQIVSGQGLPLAVSARKCKALLAVLARLPRQRHTREKLATLLWPDAADGQARANLRQALRSLRKILPEPGVVSEGDVVFLDATGMTVDVVLFDRLVEEGTPDALAEAVALYRGEFLEGLVLREETFFEWVDAERAELRERARAAMSALLDHYAETARSDQAVQIARRLLTLDPLQEEIQRRLIQLYAEQGRRSAAVEQYRRCRDILRRELGVGPEPETEELYRHIRHQVRHVDPTADRHQSARLMDDVLERPAVAVLPFIDLDRDPTRTYFADGLSEDIVTALAAWRCFPLIASTSTFAFRDRRSDPRDIASELGARYLVDGSFRRSARKVRISARLVDATTAHCLWADGFDLDLHDVLAVQEEASHKIAAAVEPELERAELRRIVTKRTEDWSAWDHFLQGAALVKHWKAESNARARDHFRRAIRLDPIYSDAFMGLASGHLHDIVIGAAVSREETLAKGFEAARQAVSLDGNSSSAHLALAHAFVWTEDLETAIAETERAIELNPSNAAARLGLGNRLDLIGRTAEGIAQMQRALQLNPCDPSRTNYMGFLARAYVTLGEYETALQWAQKAVQLRPDQPGLRFRLAICLGHLDHVEEARAALMACERMQPGFLESHKNWQPYSDAARNEHFFTGLKRHKLFG